MRAAYSLSYRLGLSSWDKTGPDADAAFMRMLDREELERDAPFGRALDLGCGTGAHTRQLRERGWEATGIDNVRRAVDVAILRSDENSRYVIGDVDHLEGCGVGKGFSFYLDMGCFHGLSDEARMAMGRGVTALAEKDATLLMLCFTAPAQPADPARGRRRRRQARAAGLDTPGRPRCRHDDPAGRPRAACAAVVQVRAQLTPVPQRAAGPQCWTRGATRRRRRAAPCPRRRPRRRRGPRPDPPAGSGAGGARRPRRPAAHPPRSPP